MLVYIGLLFTTNFEPIEIFKYKMGNKIQYIINVIADDDLGDTPL